MSTLMLRLSAPPAHMETISKSGTTGAGISRTCCGISTVPPALVGKENPSEGRVRASYGPVQGFRRVAGRSGRQEVGTRSPSGRPSDTPCSARGSAPRGCYPEGFSRRPIPPISTTRRISVEVEPTVAHHAQRNTCHAPASGTEPPCGRALRRLSPSATTWHGPPSGDLPPVSDVSVSPRNGIRPKPAGLRSVRATAPRLSAPFPAPSAASQAVRGPESEGRRSPSPRRNGCRSSSPPGPERSPRGSARSSSRT